MWNINVSMVDTKSLEVLSNVAGKVANYDLGIL